MLATSFAAVVSSQLFTISPSIYLFIGEAQNPLNLLARDRIFRDYTSDNSDASHGLGWYTWTRNRATHTGIQPGALNEVWIKMMMEMQLW